MQFFSVRSEEQKYVAPWSLFFRAFLIFKAIVLYIFLRGDHTFCGSSWRILSANFGVLSYFIRYECESFPKPCLSSKSIPYQRIGFVSESFFIDAKISYPATHCLLEMRWEQYSEKILKFLFILSLSVDTLLRKKSCFFLIFYPVKRLRFPIKTHSTELKLY